MQEKLENKLNWSVKGAKVRSQLASPLKASHARTSHARLNLCFARTSHMCECAQLTGWTHNYDLNSNFLPKLKWLFLKS